MAAELHLVKLCVGAESIADLQAWQSSRIKAGYVPLTHVTRMWPRRSNELLDGGSLYWVIKGVVLVRQSILGFDPHTGDDGIERCGIVLDPELVRTRAQPRRPFQGWRYLKGTDAPNDLTDQSTEDLPPTLAAELSAIGVR
ncbi:MAG: DUF1489 domain-containing protein [Pseudomonadota bacterium]